jgi:hypothetical protein
MKGKIARIVAASGMLATLGVVGLGSSASAAPSAEHFIDHYSTKASCQVGGEYYLRHGYSYYECYRESAGWGLYVWD